MNVMRLYEQLKQWERPNLITELRMLEELYSEEDYERVKKEPSP